MPSGDGTPRTYSISQDTANGTFNPAVLKVEIEADVGITTALRAGGDGGWKTTRGDVMDLYFVSALSGGEITALDAVVASAAIDEATTNSYQFWESNGLQATELQSWQVALARTAAPVVGGIYRLSWSCELRIVPVGPLNSGGVAHFAVDGTVKSDAYYRGIEWNVCTGWDRITLEEGDTPLLEIEWRRDPNEGPNDSIEIRKLKLGIELMG
jgi:hypothetical protein